MYNIIFEWLGLSDLNLSSDVQSVITCFFSLVILAFILDFFKMIYYTISRR